MPLPSMASRQARWPKRFEARKTKSRSSRSACRRALQTILYLVLSEPLLDEVRRKLVERFGLDPREALIQTRRLALLAVRIPALPAELPRLASDPDDDHVVATGIYGRAQAIVTSDMALLDDGSYEHEGQSVAVVSFDDFASGIEGGGFSLSQVPEVLSIATKPGLPPLDLEL